MPIRKPKTPKGRKSGFSKLLNEKTFVHEPNELDKAVSELCKVSANTIESSQTYKKQLQFIGKMCKALCAKLRTNRHRIQLEDFLPLSRAEDVLLQERKIVILVVIKKPANWPIAFADSTNYVHISLPKSDDSKRDKFELIRATSEGKENYVSPLKMAACLHELLDEGFKFLHSKGYDKEIRLDDIKLLESSRLISCDVVLLDGQTDVNMVECIDELDCKPIPDLPTKTFNISFLPAILTEPKSNLYFVSSPYEEDCVDDVDEAWRYCYSLREDILFDRIFLADRQNRLQALIGLHLLCTNNPEFDAINRDHLRQIALFLAEQEVDKDMADSQRWQRKRLTECFLEFLHCLDKCLVAGHLGRFFMPELNMFQQFSRETLDRGHVRCKQVITNEESLIRAISEAADKCTEQF